MLMSLFGGCAVYTDKDLEKWKKALEEELVELRAQLKNEMKQKENALKAQQQLQSENTELRKKLEQQQQQQTKTTATATKSTDSGEEEKLKQLQRKLEEEQRLRKEISQKFQELEKKYNTEKQQIDWRSIHRASVNFSRLAQEELVTSSTAAATATTSLQPQPSTIATPTHTASDTKQSLMLDDDLLQLLHECIQNIFFPSTATTAASSSEGEGVGNVDRESEMKKQCEQVTEVLKNEIGRRHFTKLLSQAIKKVSSEIIVLI